MVRNRNMVVKVTGENDEENTIIDYYSYSPPRLC